MASDGIVSCLLDGCIVIRSLTTRGEKEHDRILRTDHAAIDDYLTTVVDPLAGN